MPPETELPEPRPEEIERAEVVARVLRDRIAAAGGAIPFTEFMRIALYEPGVGYYVGGRERLGREGDFVTAPELTPLFGQTVAGQLIDILARVGGGDVVEAGSGSGELAAQVLAEMDRLGAPPRRYRILEVSPDLRERQQRTLGQSVPELLERVEWIEDLPDESWSGVMLANELLDSFPVHRVRLTEQGPAELYVTDTGEGFDWQPGPLSDPRVGERLREVGADDLPRGLEAEVGLAAPAWIARAGESLEQGGVLIIDYGYPAGEFYSPDRPRGTLMCHFRHRAHGDPFFLPGVQDLTAHVDFSALAEAGRRAGLEVGGFASQAQFLVNLGLTQRAEDHLTQEAVGEAERLELATALKELTLPGAMGERFKALLLVGGISGPFPGFRQGDHGGAL